MPTIQEEMSKVLTEWNQPEPQPTESKPMTYPKNYSMTANKFGVTNNVTRVTFDHVKNNPGCTATEAAHDLGKHGYKHSSVTSIMAQMYKQGLLRKNGFKYYTTQDEYVPLKGNYKSKKAKPKEVSGGIAALPQAAPAKPTAKSLLDTLTVKEARELYMELKEYFGG